MKKQHTLITLTRKNAVPISVFFVAVTLGLIYLIELHSRSPFSNYLYLDALRYDSWARSIAFGSKHAIEPVFRAPLYPIFLALIYKILGHSLFIARFVQVMMSAMTCVLIYFLALKVFNKRTAIISAFIGAFYGPFFLWAGELLIVTLIVFLDVIMLYILLNAFEKPRKIYWLLGGIVLGLSSIARPNVLIILPWVIILVFWMHKIRKVSIAKKLRSVYVLFFLAGSFAVILPLAIANYTIAKDFVLISSQGGVNFFIGNNPTADGRTARAPGIGEAHGEFQDNVWLASVKQANNATGKSLKPSQVSRYWYRQGLEFILRQPGAWIKLMSKKFAYFWTGIEVTNNEDSYYFTQFSNTLRFLMWHKGVAFPFGIICPIALVGIVVSLRRWRKLLLLYGFVFLYMLSVILFFVCARYRLPVIPTLLVFAGYTIDYGIKKLRLREYRQFSFCLAGVILVGILVNINIHGVTDMNRAQAHLFGGIAYEEVKNYELALEEFRMAIKYAPENRQAYHSLGTLYARMGKYNAAEKAFKKALEINPNYAHTHFNLGTVYTAQSKYDEALNEYETAFGIDPNYEHAAYWAAVIYERLGRWDEALKKLEKVLQINPRNEQARSKMNFLKQKLAE